LMEFGKNLPGEFFWQCEQSPGLGANKKNTWKFIPC